MTDLKQQRACKPPAASLIAGALCASVVLLLWSACWMLAEGAESKGVALLYAANRSSGTEEMWTRGFDLLSTAGTLNPLDGDYPYYSAYFLDLRAQASSRQLESRPDGNPLITEFYRRALSMRPQAGHVWAQYAQSLFHAGSSPGNTLNVLERALAFAPYQLVVLRTHVGIGLAYWDQLSEKQRQRLKSSVGYLLQLNPDDVIDTAVSNNLSDKLRPILNRQADIDLLERALAEEAKNRSADL